VRAGAFSITNSESISIGLVVHLDSLKASGKTPYDLLNSACSIRISGNWSGGAYRSNIPPTCSGRRLKGVPALYTGGMMVTGDAAGLCYTNALT